MASNNKKNDKKTDKKTLKDLPARKGDSVKGGGYGNHNETLVRAS